jgi:sugar phosphate isomerase/epimerase
MRAETSMSGLLEALVTPKKLELDDAVILALDLSNGALCENDVALCEKEFASSGGKKIIIATHQPPDFQGGRHYKTGPFTLFLAGHRHKDDVIYGDDYAVHVVRGLDPDKASGGPPCLSFFNLSHGKWTRHDEIFAGGSPDVFDDKDRREFMELLGISCMDEPVDTMKHAGDHSIRCVEVRSRESMFSSGLAEAISSWRDSGGRVLSLHMPGLQLCPDTASVINPAAWQYLIESGVKLGINQLTVHAPGVPVSRMKTGSQARRAVVQFLARCLVPVLKKGIIIGIENMHVRNGEPFDERRNFGYLPDECLEFIRELKKELGHNNIGAMIDTGHARNNRPFSKRIGVSDWYARLGKEAVGYHVHQVKNEKGGMTNHLGFEGLYGPLVSLSGFFWAWKTGQLRHAPVFVEVRDMAARLRTVKLLHDAMA